MDISQNHPVLIVEDDPLVSMAVEDAITDAGFEIMVERSGDAAIAELDKDAKRFCALLTDVRMPGKADGWDVAHRARELCPTLPVIYMTGDSAYLWSVHGVPDSLLLQKPFLDAHIVSALSTLLNKGEPGPPV
jgi:DNA-binding NtrC family response regulator